MNKLIATIALLPLAGNAAMLERTDLLELMPDATVTRGEYVFYFDRSGRVEQWHAGAKRVPYDKEATEMPEGFVSDGAWRIKTIEPPEDLDKKTPEEQAAIRESIERGNTELRSVLCFTFDEREKCWDVDRTSNVRVDPDDSESELAKTQDYHLYREGRGETRDLVITTR